MGRLPTIIPTVPGVGCAASDDESDAAVADVVVFEFEDEDDDESEVPLKPSRFLGVALVLPLESSLLPVPTRQSGVVRRECWIR